MLFVLPIFMPINYVNNKIANELPLPENPKAVG